MSGPEDPVPAIPDPYFAGRIKELMRQGLLESQGNLNHIRYSEVRCAIDSNEHSSANRPPRTS